MSEFAVSSALTNSSAKPQLHTVQSFEDFRDYTLALCSPRKGLTYLLCAHAANGDARPHRGKKECLARRYVAFDLDGGVTAEEFADIRLCLRGIAGLDTRRRAVPQVRRGHAASLSSIVIARARTPGACAWRSSTI